MINDCCLFPLENCMKSLIFQVKRMYISLHLAWGTIFMEKPSCPCVLQLSINQEWNDSAQTLPLSYSLTEKLWLFSLPKLMSRQNATLNTRKCTSVRRLFLLPSYSWLNQCPSFCGDKPERKEHLVLYVHWLSQVYELDLKQRFFLLKCTHPR